MPNLFMHLVQLWVRFILKGIILRVNNVMMYCSLSLGVVHRLFKRGSQKK